MSERNYVPIPGMSIFRLGLKKPMQMVLDRCAINAEAKVETCEFKHWRQYCHLLSVGMGGSNGSESERICSDTLESLLFSLKIYRVSLKIPQSCTGMR